MKTPVLHNLRYVALNPSRNAEIHNVCFLFSPEIMDHTVFRANLRVPVGATNMILAEKLRSLADQIEAGGGPDTCRYEETFAD